MSKSSRRRPAIALAAVAVAVAVALFIQATQVSCKPVVWFQCWPIFNPSLPCSINKSCQPFLEEHHSSTRIASSRTASTYLPLNPQLDASVDIPAPVPYSHGALAARHIFFHLKPSHFPPVFLAAPRLQYVAGGPNLGWTCGTPDSAFQKKVHPLVKRVRFPPGGDSLNSWGLPWLSRLCHLLPRYT